MRKRHISNNIRLVLDIIDYSFLCPDDSFILFLDFYKAFDTVEHNFIFQTIEKFGFGDFFCKAVRTMYCKGNSSIRLKMGPRQDLSCREASVRAALPPPTYSFYVLNFFPLTLKVVL